MNNGRMMKVGLLLVGFAVVAVPVRAHAFGFGGLGLRLGADFGLGKMANSSETIPSRATNLAAIYAMPQMEIVDLMAIGVLAEYRKVGQSTEPADVQNQNLTGSGYLVGLGLGGSFLDFYGIASLDFLGSYGLSNKTADGKDSSFKSPFGFRVMVGYPVLPFVSANATFQMASYGKSVAGDTETDISANKVKEWAVRVGASVVY